MSADCDHSGAVKWNPFNKAVQCHKCGETFFRAEITEAGYVLKPCTQATLLIAVRNWTDDPSEPFTFIHLADPEVIRASAEAAFYAVRSTKEASELDLDLFKRIARAVHGHLFALFSRKIPGRTEAGGRLSPGCGQVEDAETGGNHGTDRQETQA